MRPFRSLPGAAPRRQPGGGRSSILVAALCTLAAAWWLSGARREPGGGAALPPPAGLAARPESELAPVEGGPGRVGRAQDSPERAPHARSGCTVLVDVRGRVLAAGLPVAEQELELLPLGASAAGSAWDLTDEEGRYAVQLAPGRYGVLLDGVPVPGVYLDVASDAPQVRVNLTLASVAPAD